MKSFEKQQEQQVSNGQCLLRKKTRTQRNRGADSNDHNEMQRHKDAKAERWRTDHSRVAEMTRVTAAIFGPFALVSCVQMFEKGERL